MKRIVIMAMAVIAVGSSWRGDGVSLVSSGEQSRIAWSKTLTVPTVGRLARGCKYEPFRSFTRYRAANRAATHRVRYVTSDGDEASKRLQPGERFRSEPARSGESFDWYVIERSKPETIRLHFRIVLSEASGCRYPPIAKVSRRSNPN